MITAEQKANLKHITQIASNESLAEMMLALTETKLIYGQLTEVDQYIQSTIKAELNNRVQLSTPRPLAECIQEHLERSTETESLQYISFVDIPSDYGKWFLAICRETKKHYHLHINNDEMGLIITDIQELNYDRA